MKKSIALISVIIFIFIVFAIISSILKITYNKNDNYIVKNSLLIMNIENILSTISKDINSSDDLKKLFITFPISSKDRKFFKIVTIKPMNDKINLNQYSKGVSLFLDNILNFYDVKDPIFFKNLILDTLDKDKIERDTLSEITLIKKFPNGIIYNFKQFNQILDYYVKETDDKSIYNIPWKKFIYFSKTKQSIECNLLKDNQILLKFLNIDDLDCKNLRNINKELKLGIIPFSKDKDFILNIELNGTNNLNLMFSIKKRKVISIESYPIY